MMALTEVLLTQQMLVFLCMATVFTGAFWFVSPHVTTRSPQSPIIRDPMTNRQRADGATFIPSWAYRHYRNPMRTLRKYLGYLSGRQWVRARKRYNREFPDGARRFANVVHQMQVTEQTRRASAPASFPNR